MDLLAARRRFLMQGGLPAAYQQVEYIQSTGTQYIQTDYTPTRDDVISVTAEPTASSSEYRVLLSAGTGTYQLVVLFPQTIGSGYGFFRYFSSGDSAQFYDSTEINNKYTFTVRYNNGNGYLYIGDTVKNYMSYQSVLDGDNTTMSVLKRRNGLSPYYGKLYGVQITNSGAKTFNLLPCVRKSDSKPGMYDTVSHTFYTNAGTGEFVIPLPDTSPKIAEYGYTLNRSGTGKEANANWCYTDWYAVNAVSGKIQ